jgi:hypothetical protein
MPCGIPNHDDLHDKEHARKGDGMPHTPDRNEHAPGDQRPIWAVRPSDPAWDAPIEQPAADARFAVAERRTTLRGRVAGRTAGLLAVGALLVAGVAGAAFADTGTVTSDGTSVTATTDGNAGSASTGSSSDQGATSSTDSGATTSDPGTSTGSGGATTSTGGGAATTPTQGSSGPAKVSHPRRHRRRHHVKAAAAPVSPPASAWQQFQTRTFYDYTPAPATLPAVRAFSKRSLTRLLRLQRQTGVAWSVLAAVQKLKGHHRISLHSVAVFLRHHGARRNPARPFRALRALRRYYHNNAKAERAAALAAYYWAIRGVGVTRGLAAARTPMANSLLRDRRITIYDGGRSDLSYGLIDPRVMMSIRYLEAAFGSVRVSCLISGHSLLTASGNISAHVSGRAVDIAAVGGTDILGHQGPGTVTERAVRLLLMLPKDAAPNQIVSLMDLDGPTGNTGSFALPDHYDHIHIGFQ